MRGGWERGERRRCDGVSRDGAWAWPRREGAGKGVSYACRGVGNRMDERSRDARWTGREGEMRSFRREETDFAKGAATHGIFGASLDFQRNLGPPRGRLTECSTSGPARSLEKLLEARNVSSALMGALRYNCRAPLGVPIRAHWPVRAVSRRFTYANYSRITGGFDRDGGSSTEARPCAEQEGDGGRFRGPDPESA